jgi:c-di-GMP-binding flagellar brake protein YcgR
MANRLEENRSSFRIKLQAPLRYQIRGKPEFNNTVTNNISLGGLSFSNSSFIPLDTLLMLQVNILSRVVNPIGRIAWANSVPRSDRYQFGVEFMEMDMAEKRYLTDYVDMKTA